MDHITEIKVVDTALPTRPRASLEAVAEFLEAGGTRLQRIRLGDRGLPKRPKEARKTWDRFTATPRPLLEAWRIARHVEAASQPGDVLLMSDYQGIGGMVALEQAGRDPAERRPVVVVAADGAALEYHAVTGTDDGLPPELEHAVDWELVSYRYADAVAATSRIAVDYLAARGIAATVAVAGEDAAPPPTGEGPPRRLLLPEPVSRLAQTPRLLRAVSGLLDLDGVVVFVSAETRRDRIWTGSTWDALAGVRDSFGSRLRSTTGTERPDAVILGEPFALPPPAVAGLRAAGVPVYAYRGSTAAALWPDAIEWEDEDHLAGMLAKPPAPPAPRPGPGTFRLADPPVPDLSRAQRVSAAIPIFREVRYLDEAVQSLLDQDQPPVEIVLVDDGSRSTAVTNAIETWITRRPGVIRSLRQPNRGVCAARNLALEDMRGDSFVFLDADDVLEPAFISRCAALLRARPELWAAATWTEFFGEYEAIEAKPPFDRRVGLRENTIISTAVLADMAVRDAGIRFAPDLAFIYCEDWEVWSRIVAAGGRMGLVPEALARHRVHTASGGFKRTTLAHSLGRARATRPLRDM